ncbi:MAG TPA: ribonuclease D [Gammaproteobacteria bacterium]|nr:ribonuclease D [Gammaproteobacteria bacterium]
MTDFLYLDTDGQLADFCRELVGSPWIGIDTEFLREKTYYPRLCLVQVANERHVACIDPLAIADLSPLGKLFTDPAIVKVLHAARQDVEVLLQGLDAAPQPLFDTQTAAAFCGLGDQVSYAALTEAIAGVQLAKAHTRADWSRRPLEREVLAYAADDVRYLGPLYRKLRNELESAERTPWFEAEMAALADPAIYVVEPETAWQRLRGQSRLTDPGARGVMGTLAAWRERRAMQKNRPRRWILTDETLLELAAAAPRSPDGLNQVSGVTGLLRAGLGDELIAAIVAGVAQPLPPSSLTALTGEQRDAAKRLATVVRERAARMNMTPALLANRKQLEQMVRGERDLPVLSGWRLETIGKELLAALEKNPSLPA